MRPLLVPLLALVCLPVAAPDALGGERVRPRAPVALEASTPGDELVLLLRATRTAAPEESEALEARLALLAPAAVERALVVLAEQRLPARSPEERDQTLSEPQTELLLGVLGGLPRDSAWRALDGWLGERRDVPARAAALAFGGRIARARELGRLLDLASDGPKAAVDARLERAFEDAVVAVLRRDGTALAALTAERRRLPAALVPAYLRALGRSGDDRALDAIDHALDAHPQHAVLVLAQVRLLPPARTPQLGEPLARRLRSWLERVDPGPSEHVQAVLLALGQLEDVDAAELAVERLEDTDRGIAESARWALERISAQRFPSDQDHWSRWLRSERTWFEGRRQKLLEDLASGRPALVSDALREVVAHRLYRHEIAEDLLPSLRAPSPALRALVCRVLGQLGSPRAQRALVEALADEDTSVAEAAHAALEALTGRKLPEARAACLTLLFPAELAF